MTHRIPAAMSAGHREGQNKHYDAGTRHYDHYAARLPRWRYILRQSLLPLVRAETPPLARMQELIRTPLLDSYFAFGANLGTHTFFMIGIPVMFWCGYNEFARAIVNMLAGGVIISGIIKDLLCLPRPVSPPLHRITMSGSAALEYGFPSTHSTNAISVALYALYMLPDENSGLLYPNTLIMLKALCYLYAFSISFGRLYCGMHGFTDVVSGGLLGALVTALQFRFGEEFYRWLVSGSFFGPLMVFVILALVVRTHPEPADNCPCFDDSVAFSGVLIGAALAYWNAHQSHAFRSLVPFPFMGPGLPEDFAPVPIFSLKTLIRIPLGIFIIFVFRAVTKPLMLHLLPPLFRSLESLDLDLPRRYFLKASEYQTVPTLKRDDNVLPSPSEMGRLLGDVRRRRGRAISIGPQSVADAYEVIAYNEGVRRRSRSSSTTAPENRLREINVADAKQLPAEDESAVVNTPTSISSSTTDPFVTAISQRLEETNNRKPAVNRTTVPPRTIDENDQDETEDAKERRAIFSSLTLMRIKYDVEVVTKLIVYTGIAWWAIEGCQVVFEMVGVGPDRIVAQ